MITIVSFDQDLPNSPRTEMQILPKNPHSPWAIPGAK